MFGGQYNPTDPPQRGGVFINVRTVDAPRSRAGSGGVVGVVGVADWGPDNELVELTSSNQASTLFGSSGTIFFAIDQALEGEGRPDRSGAQIVKAYRMAAAAAAKAAVTLNNTTPVAALVVAAKYKGTRGNNFVIKTQTNPIDGTKRDLILYEGTAIRESYTYSGTGATILADLSADINSRSSFITTTVSQDGTPLAAVASSPLVGGHSGAVVTTTEHANARAAFESDANFDAFAVDDWAVLGAPEQLAYRDWTVRLVEEGKLFHLVVGGALNETTSTALARSVTLDTPDVTHTSGLGDMFVNISRDLIINGTTYSSSKMAPRIAGVLSAAGARRSISGGDLVGASLSNSPSQATIETLVRGGVIPFIKDGTRVRLDRGRTAYATSVAASLTKSAEFKSILFVRKLWFTFKAMDELVSTQLIGKPIQNTISTKETILGMFEALLKRLEDEGMTIPGATVAYDPGFDNDGETLHLLFKYTPAPGIEQVLAQVSIPV